MGSLVLIRNWIIRHLEWSRRFIWYVEGSGGGREGGKERESWREGKKMGRREDIHVAC